MHAKCKAEGDAARVWLGYVLCESSQLTQFRLRLTSAGVSGGCLLEVLRESGSDTECLDGLLTGLHDHFGAQTASYISGAATAGRRRGCCPPPCSDEEEGEGGEEEEGSRSAGIAALSEMLLRGPSQEALQCIGQLSYNRNKTVLESENLLSDVSRFLAARIAPTAAPGSSDACMVLALTCSCLRNMLSGVASTGVLNGMLVDAERVSGLRVSLQSLEGREGGAFIDSCLRSEARRALELLSAVALSR
jgi:hypothetical protein